MNIIMNVPRFNFIKSIKELIIYSTTRINVAGITKKSSIKKDNFNSFPACYNLDWTYLIMSKSLVKVE